MKREDIEKAAKDYSIGKTYFRRNVLKEVDADNYVLRKGNCSEDFIAGAEWQAKQSPWISVKDRLPQTDDDLYIVLDARMNPPGCGVCDFNPKTKTWIDYDCNIVHPTHWMPIPSLESNDNE